ncbi:MAG: hypothetical protein IKU20_03625, partial [Lachnospiraceae bacterium]|nr:hypothetical protein [Lachnospiraceae bacterium]
CARNPTFLYIASIYHVISLCIIGSSVQFPIFFASALFDFIKEFGLPILSSYSFPKTTGTTSLHFYFNVPISNFDMSKNFIEPYKTCNLPSGFCFVINKKISDKKSRTYHLR